MSRLWPKEIWEISWYSRCWMWTRFQRTRLSRQWLLCPLSTSSQHLPCRPDWVPPVLGPRTFPTEPGLLGPPGMFQMWSHSQVTVLLVTESSIYCSARSMRFLSPLPPLALPCTTSPPAWWALGSGHCSSHSTCLYTSACAAPILECPASSRTCDRSVTNSLERRAIGAVWP